MIERIVNTKTMEANVKEIWTVHYNMGGGLHPIRKLTYRKTDDNWHARNGNYLFYNDPKLDITDGYCTYAFATKEEAKEVHTILKNYINMVKNTIMWTGK